MEGKFKMNKLKLGKDWTVKIAEVLLDGIELDEVLDYLKSIEDVIIGMNSNQDYMLVEENKSRTYIIRKNEKDLELAILSIMDAKDILKK